VLLQVPHNLNLGDLEDELLAIDGVQVCLRSLSLSIYLSTYVFLQGIHEFHVWELDSDKVVGSLHAMLYEGTDFMKVSLSLSFFSRLAYMNVGQMSDVMKLVMHNWGIHSTTIQPEYVHRNMVASFLPLLLSSPGVHLC
jgi:hypothetical protein